MINFAAITPHPPIIIPPIGKENLEQAKATLAAMKELAQQLYATKPDIILIISPHSEITPEAFTINLASKYLADFEQFGDYSTKLEFKSSPKLCLSLEERLEDAEIPINLTSNEKLDHGISVPLFYLAENLKNIPIIPISFSFLSLKEHFDFGAAIKKELVKDDKRIAVIASGDLSHRVTKDAPAGFSPRGQEFDNQLVELVKNKEYKKILKLDPELIEEAGECGLRSIIILLGIIEQYNYRPEILSYEAPFGVGYLVANMKMG